MSDNLDSKAHINHDALRPAGGATICTASFSQVRYRANDCLLARYDAQSRFNSSVALNGEHEGTVLLRHPCQLVRDVD